MIKGIKQNKIAERTFKFDGDKIKNKLVYMGKGASSQPDKRFDSNCEGLSIFIYPSGVKVFYAFAYVDMFNKKKNKMEKNCIYKKMFRYQDVQGYKYRDAKDQLKAALEAIRNPLKIKKSKLFKELATDFIKNGLDGLRTKGFSDHKYKEGTKTRYRSYVNTYILLKHKNKDVIKSLTKQIFFRNKVSTKPIGDYLVSEISHWHLECVRERLKDIPSTAENVAGMVSIIFKWAIENHIYAGKNPADDFVWTQTRPLKAKLLDADTAKLKAYVLGKAFDYHPHFVACVGLHLLTGQRSLDLFGLRWESPNSDEEKNSCSGWLLEGWENSNRPTLHFWTTKTHKPADIHIDQTSLSILKRLREANLREKNKWALKSPFVFPQIKNPHKHVTTSSYQRPLIKLNSILGFERLEGDNISRVRGKRKIFTFKIARKTFATEVARNKGGIELAARKLNHSSSAVTRRNYIVPDAEEMIIENLYEKNLPEKDVAVVVKSPWNKKPLSDKE